MFNTLSTVIVISGRNASHQHQVKQTVDSLVMLHVTCGCTRLKKKKKKKVERIEMAEIWKAKSLAVSEVFQLYFNLSASSGF